MEKTIVLERGCCPYMSKKQLAKELGYGETSIYNLIKGLEKEVGPGKRYDREVIAGTRYNFFAVIDFMTYRDLLGDPVNRKHVPDFNPAKIANLCGREVRRIK